MRIAIALAIAACGSSSTGSTTANLIAALGALSQAGVERVQLHRMMGWGALGPTKKVNVADPGDLVVDTRTIEIGDPHVDGGLSATGVHSALEGYERRFVYCYEMRDRPQLHGSVQLAFDVTAAGEIRKANATGLDAKIASCIAGAVFDLDLAPAAVHGAGHARASIAFTGTSVATDAAPVSGFWCFQDSTVGLCAREEAQCQAALDGFNGAAASLHDTTINSPCATQTSAWTHDGQHWSPTKALCGASCRQVH